MTPTVTLAITERQHRDLERQLFPGDGLEAAAILLCGRANGAALHRLAVHDVVPIPYAACKRTAVSVAYPTSILQDHLARAKRQHLAFVKVHSHPMGLAEFSGQDDKADADLFPYVDAVVDGPGPHASVVMLPGGPMFGRAHHPDGERCPLSKIVRVGHNIAVWPEAGSELPVPGHAVRTAQTLGKQTYAIMRRLRIGVIGASGTGSLVIEQLARYSVGELVIIDPKPLTDRNLNRIVNSTSGRVGDPKVEVMADAIDAMGLGTAVETHAKDLRDPDALRAVTLCDVVFGCMDDIPGRDVLNRISTYYSIPYVDVGVSLDADGEGGIENIAGAVHYIQPGGSSLLSRRAYTAEKLRAAALRESAPEAYRAERDAGYLASVGEERPAVISVNMFFSSLAVLEFLARIHPFRHDPNSDYAKISGNLTTPFIHAAKEGSLDETLAPYVGRGDAKPPLGRPFLRLRGAR